MWILFIFFNEKIFCLNNKEIGMFINSTFYFLKDYIYFICCKHTTSQNSFEVN